LFVEIEMTQVDCFHWSLHIGNLMYHTYSIWKQLTVQSSAKISALFEH